MKLTMILNTNERSDSSMLLVIDKIVSIPTMEWNETTESEDEKWYDHIESSVYCSLKHLKRTINKLKRSCNDTTSFTFIVINSKESYNNKLRNGGIPYCRYAGCFTNSGGGVTTTLPKYL